MAISFSKALGLHEQALMLRNQRTALLADNIANASTPGYKARDLDFRQVLAEAGGAGGRGVDVRRTHQRHIEGTGGGSRADVLYRVPAQPSLDGNTVDEQVENAIFARHALEHQASFQFLNGKFVGLMKALRGE